MATGLFSKRDYNRRHRSDAFQQNNHCPICKKPIQDFSEACCNHWQDLKRLQKQRPPNTI